MDERLLERLYKPFENIKERDGLAGLKFKFISGTDVIDRMNKVFKGNWSTEVMSQEVIEDTVVMRVKVLIYYDGLWFSHDGYGSSAFKRYASGKNVGKIIDVGNGYKSAETMAIRNACTRFGCGLYLEEDSGYEYDSDLPTISEKSSVPNLKSIKKENLSSSPTPPPPPSSSPTPLPSPPSSPTPPPPKRFIRDDVKISNKKEAHKEEVVLKVNNNSVSKSNITDVQIAALNALINMSKLDYKKFVKDGLNRSNIVIPEEELPELEKLSYEYAIILIRYGNEVVRKK